MKRGNFVQFVFVLVVHLLFEITCSYTIVHSQNTLRILNIICIIHMRIISMLVSIGFGMGMMKKKKRL